MKKKNKIKKKTSRQYIITLIRYDRKCSQNPLHFTKYTPPCLNRNENKMADAVRIDRIRMLKEQATNPDRRDKINRILTDLGKFAVDSAVNDSLKAVNGCSLLSLSHYVYMWLFFNF